MTKPVFSILINHLASRFLFKSLNKPFAESDSYNATNRLLVEQAKITLQIKYDIENLKKQLSTSNLLIYFISIISIINTILIISILLKI
jgi:hypothetical protein